MKKKATRKSEAAAKKKTPVKKATLKKTTPKGTRKKTANQNKPSNKKTPTKKATEKKTPARKRSQNAVTKKKPGGKNQPKTDADSLTKVSTVFAATEPNEYQPYPLLRIIKDDEIILEKRAREEELAWQYQRAEKAYEQLCKEVSEQQKRKKKKKGSDSKKDAVDYGDVTGIEIGFRTKFGYVVSPLQYVLTVNVSRKRELSELGKRNISPLPKAIEGVPVKVLEGEFEQADQVPEGRLASGTGPATRPAPDQPLLGGQPIAEIGSADNFGTLGMVVGTKDSTNFGITNKHVTSNQTIRLTTDGDQHVGEVIKAIEMQSSKNHYVDSSYFSLQIQEDLESLPYQIKGINDDGAVDLKIADRAVESSELGIPVFKYGAKTGTVLQGYLASVKAQVNVGGKLREGVLKAENPSDTFLMGGDSGSFAMAKAKVGGKLIWLVIGLVFAQKMINGIPNDRIAYICHIKDVIDELGLSSQIPADRLTDIWENIF